MMSHETAEVSKWPVSVRIRNRSNGEVMAEAISRRRRNRVKQKRNHVTSVLSRAAIKILSGAGMLASGNLQSSEGGVAA